MPRLTARGTGRDDIAPPPRELSLAVVGITHPNPDGSNRRFEIATLHPGDPVELRREPRNKHDPFAVGVWSPRNIRLGYLSAERAPWIGAKLLDRLEVQAVFQEVTGPIAVIRARIGGGTPTLPPGKPPRPATEDGFYPDDDGPDWGAQSFCRGPSASDCRELSGQFRG